MIYKLIILHIKCVPCIRFAYTRTNQPAIFNRIIEIWQSVSGLIHNNISLVIVIALSQ